ncbi:disease resistance protein RPS2-like [Typha latifolia]|uniref:disease resistance protein RPS2-like n=1 Tax=Typha latifolia TaxID=4733 RepID=UPI003C2FD610
MKSKKKTTPLIRAAKKRKVQKVSARRAFESVAEELPPLIQDMPTTSNASSQVDPNLQEALRYLIEDDAVTRIGIWGMGASKECSVANVQDEILRKLGLDRSTGVQLNAETISNFLTRISFLLLVDDLWEYLDLKAVGVPILPTANDHYKQKVVLTTRSDEVRMSASRLLALILPYPDIAKDVVKRLGGLPLALITIGHSMHAKKDYRSWRRALELLKESRLHEIERGPNAEENTTFHTLKFSYESLKSNDDALRHCFLSCSMWPEDYKISKEELIRSWIGLGLVKMDGTLRSCYEHGYCLIDQLQAACLLEDSSSYMRDKTEKSVQMHGMLRDMALWIAREYGENNNKWIVKAAAGQAENTLSEAERISLMIMDKDEKMPLPYNTLPPLTKRTTVTLRGYKLHGTKVLDLFNNSVLHPRRTGYPPSLLEELKSLNNLRALGVTAAGESQFHLLKKSTNLPIQYLGIHSLNERALSLTINFLGNLTRFGIMKSGTEIILIESGGQNANSHLDLEILSFSWMPLETIMWREVSPKDVFLKLRQLKFVGCNQLKNISWIVYLPHLWELKLLWCKNLKYVICCREDNHGDNSTTALTPTFPCLGIMVLERLINLRAICDPGVTFPSLRYLYVAGCDKLKKLPFQLYNLPSKLEKIEGDRRFSMERF